MMFFLNLINRFKVYKIKYTVYIWIECNKVRILIFEIFFKIINNLV